MEQVLVGRDKRKSGVLSTARPTSDPGGMVLRRFGDGHVWTDSCRMVELFRVDGRPGKVDGSVAALEMDRWKMAATALESASVRYGT